MSTAFVVAAVLCALWGVVDAMLILAALEKRGIQVSMLLFRLFFFRYLRQYRDATRDETGRVRPLCYSCIAAMSGALVCAVIGLALRMR